MPSEKVLSQKKQVVVDLTEKLKSAISGVLVDYRGLTVEQDTELRNELRKSNVEYSVIKNTLLRFAANEVGYNDLDPILHGPTALALSDSDIVAPAKVISEFIKKNPTLEIKSGFVEGKVVSIDDIKTIADLPPKEVLIAKVLCGFNAPIAGFANVLNGNIRGLAVALSAIAEKKAAEA